VDEFLASGGIPSNDWNQGPNADAIREGMATWIPLTDEVGNPLPGITDPFRNGPTNDPRTNSDTRGGRPAADDAGGTPYGRPEDMAISRLANGNEVVYITVTSENKLISVEILEHPGRRGKGRGANGGSANGRPSGRAIVRTLVSNTGTPKNLGFAPTTGVLNSPDNIALDALGNVYVIEDAPNGSATGGDIWFVRDANNDGVAESLDHFMSVRVKGCEATGMIFNPANPLEFVVAVMHPDSTDLANVPNGLGDAVWMFNLTYVPNQDFVRKLNKANGFTNQ
jgi:secreted PhoX family phosphatase